MNEEINSETMQAWDAARNCDYCDGLFKPKRPQDKNQRFCCDNHRKDYFRYGAKLKIVAAVRADIERDLRALERRIEVLEKKYRKTLDMPSSNVVTLKPNEAQQ